MNNRSFGVNFKSYDSKSKPLRAYSTNAAIRAFWGYKERNKQREMMKTQVTSVATRHRKEKDVFINLHPNQNTPVNHN